MAPPFCWQGPPVVFLSFQELKAALVDFP